MKKYLTYIRVFAFAWLATLASPQAAEVRSFHINGAELALSDLSNETAVFFRSMRLNRAANVWNVEVVVSNAGPREIHGPLILSAESFQNMSGMLASDGTNSGRAFVNLTSSLNLGILAPGHGTIPHTLSLGITSGTPTLQTKVFGPTVSSGTLAAALTRSLNEAGQPLGEAQVTELGPDGVRNYTTDSRFGLVTLGQTPGNHQWKFSRSNYLSVWRRLLLGSNGVAVLPNPRLVSIETNRFGLGILSGGTSTNRSGTVIVTFAPGTISTVGSGSLTELTAQTLPAFLPVGWSPLQAFSLELTAEPSSPGTASLRPWGSIEKTETSALVKWNPASFEWLTVQLLAGNGTEALNVNLPGSGTYALVVPDAGLTAPAGPIAGQALPSSSDLSGDAELRASGSVSPTTAAASGIGELITATGIVTFTNLNGAIPSGILFRCEVRETYQLQDGTRRGTPQYETFISGFRRPQTPPSSALGAKFPIRPLLLLGNDELQEARIVVDILASGAFAGQLLQTNGGLIAGTTVRVLAGSGDLSRSGAALLREVNPTNFFGVLPSTNAIVAAFELTITGIAEGRRLFAQFDAQAPNSFYVLARVVTRNGIYGLEPVERFSTDSRGILSSLEPSNGERLPGIDGAGQYVLVRVNGPQALVRGKARDASGQPGSSLAVRLNPWVTFSDTNGLYRLVSPIGPIEAAVIDVRTGDVGRIAGSVIGIQDGLNLDVSIATTGPRVVTVSPAANATGISRVTPIVLTFSEPINGASLTGGEVVLLNASNQPVPVSVSMNLKGTAVTLLPLNPLSPLTRFNLSVSTNLADLKGRKLEGSNLFSFTTETDSLNRNGNQLDSYEPTNGVARLVGGAGLADPEAPVILINDTTGATATILSRIDGSFSNSIPADVDDTLRAVIVNENGTRLSVPVTRQFFQNGSVGLFSAGGTIEVQGEDGPIQVTVPAGTIANKTQIRVAALSTAQMKDLVAGAPATNAIPLGAFAFTQRGDQPTSSLDISFAVNPDRLQLVDGITQPEEASFVLAAVTEVDGVKAYNIVDRMHYKDGKLVTGSFPLIGLLLAGIDEAWNVGAIHGVVPPLPSLSGFAIDLALVPFQLTVRRAFTVTGIVSEGAEVFAPGDIPQSLQPGNVLNPNNASAPQGGRILAGALVQAIGIPSRGGGAAVNQQLFGARLPAGALYGISDGTGRYAIHMGFTQDSDLIMLATHPRFPARRAAAPGPPFTGFGTTRINIIFPIDPSVTGDGVAPTVNLSHQPARPSISGTATIVVSAVDGDSRPAINLTVLAVTNFVAVGTNLVSTGLPLSVMSLSNVNQVDVGAYGKRATYVATSLTNAEIIATFQAVATDATGLKGTNILQIAYGGSDPAGTNSIPLADSTDTVGPSVIQTWPPNGSSEWAPGTPLRVVFSEAVNREILSNSLAISISPSAGSPTLVIGQDQTELQVTFPDLKADQTYRVTFSTAIRDIAGNSFDQDPGSPGFSSHSITLRTAPTVIRPLSGVSLGGGSVLKGGFAFVLDRLGETEGGLLVYDAGNPAAPSRYNLPPFPRDVALISNYSFKRTTNGPVETKDFLAIVGGTVGGVPGIFNESSPFQAAPSAIGGPWFWLMDITDPAAPSVFGTALLSLNTLSVVSRVIWKPPVLGYLENSGDTSTNAGVLSDIGLINLQAFIIDKYLPVSARAGLPFEGSPGLDKDGNGDFVGPNDQLPLPSKFGDTFGGKVLGLDLGDARQLINDFGVGVGGFFVSAVVKQGVLLNASGEVIPNSIAPAAYRTLFAGRILERVPASVIFSNATPMRVQHRFAQELVISNQTVVRDLALVSLKRDNGSNGLVVIDISDPISPVVLNEIPIALPGATPFAVVDREDGLLGLATGTDVMLLDPRLLVEKGFNGSIPALIGILHDAGAGARSFAGRRDGLNIISLGGKNEIVQAPPTLRFVSSTNIIPYASLAGASANAQSIYSSLLDETSLFAGRIKSEGGATSTVTPPNAGFHYYVLVDAPGASGEEITLGVESLNRAGYPLKNKGSSFPPVRAVSSDALAQIKQSARPNCDLTIRPLLAHRLTNNPASPLYNVYLSKPIVMTYERMDEAQLTQLRNDLDREILWSGHYLRAFIDSSMSGNPTIGKFAALIDSGEKIISPRASTVAETFPGTYIMGPNPPGLAGHDEVPGTFGTISAHNGEFRHDTVDMTIPGRGMPVVFQRSMGGQDLYDGPFGRGWDFYHNQHLTELRSSVFASSSRKPLILRATAADSVIASQRDVEFHTGEGRTILFKFKGNKLSDVPELSNDPLVRQLGWHNVGANFYLPERGCFDLLFRFQDGQFARLTPDGMQSWYSKSGRLEKIYGRYPSNQQTLSYNQRGELIRITDTSIPDGARFLEVGYWRLNSDSLFKDGLDGRTENVFIAGKIRSLRDYTLSVERTVLFTYNDDGLLSFRDGPLANGANGGFNGRQRTIYLSSDGCGVPAMGIVTGNGSTLTGTPLFTVQTTNNAGAMTGGNGAAGSVAYSPLSANTAATVENSTAITTGPDGARTQFKFDKDGYAKEISFQGATSGGPGTTANFKREFDTNGLLQRIVYPEGNEARYSYFTNSSNLRSRANLAEETHLPGPRGGPTLAATYSYDERYNVRDGSQKDFNSNTITYQVTPDGRDVQSITYPGAGTHTFSFNAFGQLEKETNPEGIVIDPEYNPTTGFISTRNLGGTQTRFFYDDNSHSAALGMPNRVQLPAGAEITSHYDDRLQLTDFTRGDLQEFRGYDTNGNIIYIKRKVDVGEFYEETRTYSQFNFLSSVTVMNVEVDGLLQNLTISYSPDAAWRVGSVLYPGGEKRSFSYNQLGHLTHMEIGPAGGPGYFEDYGRDLHGNLTELKQGGKVTRDFGYDGHDRLVAVTNKTSPGDEIVSFTYHGNGERKRMIITDPVYGTVADTDISVVDALGRPLQEKRAGTQVSASLGYSYNSTLLEMDGPRAGAFTKIAHDTAGRPDFYQNLLALIDYTTDGNGNITDLSSSEGGRTYNTHFFYNDLDHLERHEDHDHSPVFKYGPRIDGQFTTITDGVGNQDEQGFSRLGEKTSARIADGVSFRYQHSKQRLPTFAGDSAAGHQFEYDGTFRMKSQKLRNGASVFYENPDERNLPKKITLPGGDVTQLTYDPQGRILSRTTPYQNQPYSSDSASFDALGRLRQIKYGSAAQNTATYDYDLLGPLTKASYSEPLGPFAVSYKIYEDGTVKSVDYSAPDAVTVDEDRESSGRLTKISSGGVIYEITTFEGAELPGEISLGDGLILEKNLYDTRKRLVARRYSGPGGTLLADIRNGYDLADNHTARQFIHQNGRADLFTFDNGNRLTRADIGARPVIKDAAPRTLAGYSSTQSLLPGLFARTYGYDAGGFDELLGATNINPNALLLPSLPPFAGSISGFDGFLFAELVDGAARTPDPLGNTASTTLQIRSAAGNGPTPVPALLKYNGLSQLVQVKRNDGITVEYEHQPGYLLHHRRVLQGVSVIDDSALVYDRGRLIEEYTSSSGSSQLRARYYYADEDSPVAADLRDANGLLQRFYYLKDEQDSVIGIANANGQVIERIQYDPFGQPAIEGQDTKPPRILSVVNGINNELIIQFSERIMPPLARSTFNTNFENLTVDLVGAFTVNTANAVIDGTTIYDEANSGAVEFGALIRFIPTISLPVKFTLQLKAGALVDEWGNSNLTQLITVTNSGVPGTLLFQDPAGPGSTAAPRLARSRIGNPFLFHGQYFDYDSGLLYLRARFYDPYTGLFLQPDPMGYDGSVNLYAGFGHNPVSLRDPSGLLPGPRRPSANGGSARIVRDELTPHLTIRGQNVRRLSSGEATSVQHAPVTQRPQMTEILKTRHGSSPMQARASEVAAPDNLDLFVDPPSSLAVKPARVPGARRAASERFIAEAESAIQAEYAKDSAKLDELLVTKEWVRYAGRTMGVARGSNGRPQAFYGTSAVNSGANGFKKGQTLPFDGVDNA
ncbi:MAG: hypothetical protein JWM99_2702, partial [Verrucomicrobiales bacterium]|nr:hypothetical protein [Verrucomicrobiales bacterium]